MNGKSIQLIACDIDGTLLHDGEREIHAEVFRQILRLKEKGIAFCPASGRQYHSLRRLFAPVAGEICYLCENGAVVYGPGTPGTILSETAIPRSEAERLCADILSRPACEILISGRNMSYLIPKQDDLSAAVRDEMGNLVRVVESTTEIREEIVKISLYSARHAWELYQTMLPAWEEHFQVAVSGAEWVDFTKTDKGAGIQAISRALGIPMDRMMAIGDNYNDLPILNQVGYPVMMENAAEDLRRRFPEHCRRVEELLRTL